MKLICALALYSTQFNIYLCVSSYLHFIRIMIIIKTVTMLTQWNLTLYTIPPCVARALRCVIERAPLTPWLFQTKPIFCELVCVRVLALFFVCLQELRLQLQHVLLVGSTSFVVPVQYVPEGGCGVC